MGESSGPLLWGRYRGLFFYAPILILALPGWVLLMLRRRWGLAIVSFLVCASVLLVNLSYPEWTGGWSTGPRLLLPLIPFAMIPVAGLLASRRAMDEGGDAGSQPPWPSSAVSRCSCSRGPAAASPTRSVDAGRGRVLLTEPLADAVWPIWTGQDPIPGWRYRERFCRNLVSYVAPRLVADARSALGAAPVPAAGRRAGPGDPRPVAIRDENAPGECSSPGYRHLKPGY